MGRKYTFEAAGKTVRQQKAEKWNKLTEGPGKQRASGMAGALGYSKQKLEQGARTQKIPASDPFHGAALKKMAADSAPHDQRLEQARVHEKQSAEHFAASGSMVAQSRTVQQAAHAAAGRAHRAAGDAAVYAPHEYPDRKREAEDATAATKTHDHEGAIRPGKEQKAPMSAEEHLQLKDKHAAAARGASSPQEAEAHVNAAELHRHAADHIAGNEPRKGYNDAAARAHEASRHAEAVSTSTAEENRGQQSYGGHLETSEQHKQLAKIAQNPHERDAHLAAAAAHKDAAKASSSNDPNYPQHAARANQASRDADHATNLRKSVTAGFVAGVQGHGAPGGIGNLGHELGSKLAAAGMMKTGKVEQAKALQTGPRGGVHYVTAGGTKIYKKR